jgi:hypothetical protein
MVVRGLNSAGVAARAMKNSSEQAVTEAHAKAIVPFHQRDSTTTSMCFGRRSRTSPWNSSI